MPPSDLLVLGTGSLARATCLSLATLASPGWRVVVAGRRSQVAAEICLLANSRAAIADRDTRFSARTLDLAAGAEVRRVIDEANPRVTFLCASLQSPWEAEAQPSAWTSLLNRAGFGTTLPFQAKFAVRVAESLKGTETSFVNAGYPDAVNPLLHALALPVVSGIGNVQILAAAIAGSLTAAEGPSLRLLGHHVNLRRPASEESEVLARLGDSGLTGVGDRLLAVRSVPGSEMNWITGQGAASLLAALLDGRRWSTHLPGPGGLPGGYPVTVVDGAVSVDLPPGWTLEEAVAWNQARAGEDGVIVRATGRVELSEAAIEAWSDAGISVGPWQAADLDDVSRALEAVRDRLRTLPPTR
jgi:hypothetical protein